MMEPSILDQVALLRESILDVEDAVFEAEKQLNEVLRHVKIIINDCDIITNLQERK